MSRRNARVQSNAKLPAALLKELGIHNRKQNSNNNVRLKARDETIPVKQRLQEPISRRKNRRNHTQSISINESLGNEQNSESENSVVGRNRDVRNGPERARIGAESQPPEPKPTTKKTKSQLSSLESSTTGIESESNAESERSRSRSSSPGIVLDASSTSFKQKSAQDDADIVALEKRLGMRKRKSRKGEDEMLDYLLEGLDGEDSSQKRKREARDWMNDKRRKLEANHNSSNEDESLDNSDVSDELSQNNEEPGGSTFGQLNSGESNVDNEDDFATFDSNGEDEATEPTSKPVQRMRENPYVAPVTTLAPSAKYIPPSLRRRDGSGDEALTRLRRQAQGQLNKLSEANLVSILKEVENLYRENPRQDVTTVLIDLILASFCDRSSLQNTFIILHAAFVAAVYKVMGVDFGAELLSKLVDRFNHYHRDGGTGKEALNLISLLANLFTFNVISNHIVYDHIRLLLSEFNESNAELLLRIVRDCGPQLRSEDPTALKEIVQSLQRTVSQMNAQGQVSNIRTSVMIDTITDLKNNKMKNATNAAGVTGEHIVRMRKTLGSLNKRNLKATEPLRITRSDLENSDKKGKWWLVGASWKGNTDQRDLPNETMSPDSARGSTNLDDEAVDYVDLAKHFKMNTAVRRSIFVAIMSADNVRDARIRILKLNLTNKQEPEIVKVLLRCARAEPTYNPYYPLLAKVMSMDNRRLKMGLQFSLWDFFKGIGESNDEDDSDDEGETEQVELHEIVNVGKMYAYLIYNEHLTLGILKVLNVGMLKEQATMFLEVLIISIMTQPKLSEDRLLSIFQQARNTPQIVKSLQLFIKKTVRRSDIVPKKDRYKVKEGCKVADIALGLALQQPPDILHE